MTSGRQPLQPSIQLTVRGQAQQELALQHMSYLGASRLCSKQ